MKSHKIVVERLYHRGAWQLALKFSKDQNLIQLAKRIHCRWSATHRCWYLFNKPDNLRLIFKTFKESAEVDAEQVFNKPEEKPDSVKGSKITIKGRKIEEYIVPEEFINKLKVCDYSKSTISTYTSFFKQFGTYYVDRDLRTVTEEEVNRFMIYLADHRKLGNSSLQQAVNAIKFYYEQAHNGERKVYKFNRPRKGRSLPKVLSMEEIARMLEVTTNIKHRIIIAFLYSAGLRRGELLHLRKGDIDLDRRQIFVRGGKGKKDRVTILSERVIALLPMYIDKEKPNYWFFEGPDRKRYSAASVRIIVKEAAEKAGIAKTVTPHMLRHSFATHLLEQGTDTRYIQKCLGHSSLETTAIYEHVSNKDLQKIRSPLDQISIQLSLPAGGSPNITTLDDKTV